jgi:sugar O-acyltransferase (sialic acid O-acetyltransferase NeuD family)
MEKLLIFPFNGNGIEALDCVQGQFEVIGFIDDDPRKQKSKGFSLQVYSREIINKEKDAKILALPGNPLNFRERLKVIFSLQIPDERFATVIHPKATVSPLAHIGKNVLLMAGVVITSNGIISDHVIILPNSVIHHDSVIGTGTLIGSNVLIAGNVSVGENCYIASGSNVINGIAIGNKSILGLGTNLIKSVPENSKVVGNPGKLI